MRTCPALKGLLLKNALKVSPGPHQARTAVLMPQRVRLTRGRAPPPPLFRTRHAKMQARRPEAVGSAALAGLAGGASGASGGRLLLAGPVAPEERLRGIERLSLVDYFQFTVPAGTSLTEGRALPGEGRWGAGLPVQLGGQIAPALAPAVSQYGPVWLDELLEEGLLRLPVEESEGLLESAAREPDAP